MRHSQLSIHNIFLIIELPVTKIIPWHMYTNFLTVILNIKTDILGVTRKIIIVAQVNEPSRKL